MGEFGKYLLRRAFVLAVIVTITLALNFLIPRLTPGDPISAYVEQLRAQGMIVGEAQAMIDEFKSMFGLDKDLFTQFVNYVQQLLRGNLGISIQGFSSVSVLIARAAPWTLLLLGLSTLISWTLGALLGLILGWKRQSRVGKALSSVFLVLRTLPYYLLALILVFAFGYLLHIFPIYGAYSYETIVHDWTDLDYVKDVLWHLCLPALSIVLSSLGAQLIGMRAMITTIMSEDYVLLAEAKGLDSTHIMLNYGFRNALLPQVTSLALSLGNILGGALLTEIVFEYPGIGYLLNTAIMSSDYWLIQGITLVTTLSVCGATFLLDILYPLIDPRIKHGGSR